MGNIGSETRKKYGIVDNAVNVTQRIQAEANAGEVGVSRSI
jgi:class 3 adenylate cyclase